MNCEQFEARVDALAHNTLPQSETTQAQEHLGICASCSELYQTTIKIKQIIQDIAIPKLSDEFDSKLNTRLLNHKKTSSFKFTSVTQIHHSKNASNAGGVSRIGIFSKFVAGLAIFALTYTGVKFFHEPPPQSTNSVNSTHGIIDSLTLDEIVTELDSVSKTSGFYGMEIDELLENTLLPTNNTPSCLTKVVKNNCELLLYSTDG